MIFGGLTRNWSIIIMLSDIQCRRSLEFVGRLKSKFIEIAVSSDMAKVVQLQRNISESHCNNVIYSHHVREWVRASDRQNVATPTKVQPNCFSFFFFFADNREKEKKEEWIKMACHLAMHWTNDFRVPLLTVFRCAANAFASRLNAKSSSSGLFWTAAFIIVCCAFCNRYEEWAKCRRTLFLCFFFVSLSHSRHDDEPFFPIKSKNFDGKIKRWKARKEKRKVDVDKDEEFPLNLLIFVGLEQQTVNTN